MGEAKMVSENRMDGLDHHRPFCGNDGLDHITHAFPLTHVMMPIKCEDGSDAWLRLPRSTYLKMMKMLKQSQTTPPEGDK
jgi:hypothetical protein